MIYTPSLSSKVITDPQVPFLSKKSSECQNYFIRMEVIHSLKLRIRHFEHNLLLF